MDMRTLAWSAALALALNACGGGGGGGHGGTPMAANTPPASAARTVEGFTDYLQALVGSQDDTGPGVDVNGFVAPTSESAEPASI